MQNRCIPYSTSSIQSEVFLEALSVIMQMLGDWHTELNMAQSVYNYCYVGLLDQFQELLDWKRISKDVSKNYYQATRLIPFVHDEMIWFFAHQFISKRMQSDQDDEVSNCKFIVTMAKSFREFSCALKDRNDQWIATCGVVLEMASDLLNFVTAYQVGDVISIEYGYLCETQSHLGSTWTKKH